MSYTIKPRDQASMSLRVLKQFTILLIMSLELSIYIASVNGTRDLASTDVTKVTVRSTP